jgi:hypothetical protein
MSDAEFNALMLYGTKIALLMVAVVTTIFTGLKVKEKVDESKDPSNAKVPQVQVNVKELEARVNTHHEWHQTQLQTLAKDVVDSRHELRGEMNRNRLADALALAEARRVDGIAMAKLESRVDNTAREVQRLEGIVSEGFKGTNDKLDQIMASQGRHHSRSDQ